MHQELPDVQAGLRKGRRTRVQVANICSIIDKARAFQKIIYVCFIDYTKATDCVDHNQLWKILKDMGNLYAGQEATVTTRHGTINWINIGKGVCHVCVLSPCLFKFYAEYITQNAGLAESQAAIKIAGRNISNLRYADDTTPMAESKEGLKSSLMRVKEESEKSGLKLSIEKKLSSWHPAPSVQFSSVIQSRPILCDPMNRSTSGLQSHHFMVNRRKSGSSERVYFLGLLNHCG